MDDYLTTTQSLCATCGRLAPARIHLREDGAWMHKHCPDHGTQEARVYGDAEAYRCLARFQRQASLPLRFANAHRGCPDSCGLCPEHEQHVCLPIIEITDHCDLTCPICLVHNRGTFHRTLAEVARTLDALLESEGQVDVLNLSGGEPTCHPGFREIVDECVRRKGILRVSVSTNGLALGRDPDLLRFLAERNVIVSLQFDGLSDEAYQVLRGRPLLEAKRRLIEACGELNTAMSLTATVARGVNDGAGPGASSGRDSGVECVVPPHPNPLPKEREQVGGAERQSLNGEAGSGREAVLPLPKGEGRGEGEANRKWPTGSVSPLREVADLLFQYDHILSVMFQPVAYTGQAARLARPAQASTIPDVIAQLDGAGAATVSRDDFSPLPCSHPACFSLAFYLKCDDGCFLPIKRLVNAERYLDLIQNRALFGTDEPSFRNVTDAVYDLWSGPVALSPDSRRALAAVKRLLGTITSGPGYEPGRAWAAAERSVKSIFIHQFMDRHTFDLARARKCCQVYPQPDGTLIPACVYNCLKRP